MALDFTGIENIEFYSGHYLEAVLEGDLKGLFASWKKVEDETGHKAPYKRFNPIASAWEKARKQAGGEPNPVERWRAARAFHAELIEALGYPYAPDTARLEDDTLVPLASRIDCDGRPYLWIVDAPFSRDDSADALDSPPLRNQYPAEVEGPELQVVPRSDDPSLKGEPATWRELLDTTLFRLESAPRWILFLAGDEVLLAERHKWPAGRFLRFDLGELFARRSPKALQAFCALVHRDALAPEGGPSLHDSLEESSHKHAFAVSGDLKHGVRRAVELLANEAVWFRREKQRKGVFNEAELASGLERDCLTWLYRLLFLFYVEARGSELGVVPMKSDAYREGYSLEKLRDLELVPLTTEKMREGYYLDHSLKLLFRIVNDGFPEDPGDSQGALAMRGGLVETMRLPALRSPLFDDDTLQVLKGVKFRNRVLQEILQLLSLSAEKKRKSRGRISYAQLGINQLGAVYEGLLSYTGFFAKEDLYEVASEKDIKKLSGKPAAEREALKTYFVPASRIDDYQEREIVKDEVGRKVVHKKGTFIFRLAGRNREKSASYYTPEVLTQCLVKYALKELLWEGGKEGEPPRCKKTADEILALTICEPAMGSSAFLIEAVDQLADAYLEARQEEKGETIPPEDYQREKRRVKARLATNNCYGVDLNPTAVELAKVSLWLATLHEDGKCPWFGLRLATGNSLVGARREVFKTTDVTRMGSKDNPNWLGLVPEPVPLHHGEDAPSPAEVDWANWTAPPRPKGTIYHFLLPAEGMAAFDKDKVINQLSLESVKRIKEWRKEFCKPFTKSEAERLEQISDAVDRLFAHVVRERVLATQETSDRIPVWGEPPSAQQSVLLVCDQEEVAASLEDGSSAYRRLKLAMDAWCALWFWPIEEAGLLPDRATWLAEMELILKGQVTHEEVWQQQGLFVDLPPADHGEAMTSEVVSADVALQIEGSAERLKRLQALSDAFRDRRASYFEQCALADINAVLREDPSLRAAQSTADRLSFHHWPLRFAEVFANRGGFDLILGNPPWIKVQFNETALLSDHSAGLGLRKSGGAEFKRIRGELLCSQDVLELYFEEFTSMTGTQRFVKDLQNFSALKGSQSNLYKCFIARSFTLLSNCGITGLIHQKGLYHDPKGQSLRGEVLHRLRWLFHFSNKKLLFDSITDQKHYEVSIYSGERGAAPRFRFISNLFHPSTIDSSVHHDGAGPVPGLKGSSGSWDLHGHRERIVAVDRSKLQQFAELLDEPGADWSSARIPLIHSESTMAVVSRFSRISRRLGDLGDGYYCMWMWHETEAPRKGIIRKTTVYPASRKDWIVQGPHFFNGTPIYQTPREVCEHNQAYDEVDLIDVSAKYLPRTNYVRNCDDLEYEQNLPSFHSRPVLKGYRVLIRAFVTTTGERTLVSAIFPPEVGHVHGVIGVNLDQENLALFAAMSAALPYDFLLRIGTNTGLYDGTIRRLPFPEREDVHAPLIHRALVLNCLTEEYSALWESSISSCQVEIFTRIDRRFRPLETESTWKWSAALRSPLERRQALVELDVLVAMSLELSLEDLLLVYRVHFPVLQEYDRDRLYDQSGRVVPTSKNVGDRPALSLVELAATLKEQAGFDVHAEYPPDGSNTQELRKQKIKLGKKEADVLGVSEHCTMVDLLAETEVRWSDEDHPEGRLVRLVGLRYTDPGLEPRMERVYPTPWTRCDREADYRQAWAEFERRLGVRSSVKEVSGGDVSGGDVSLQASELLS